MTQSASTISEAPAYVPESTATPKGQQGVIGKVLEVKANTITIENIAPTKDGNGMGMKYTVTATDTTQFIYHPVTSAKDAVKTTFGSTPGALKNIKKGMYASATTMLDVSKETTFDAIEINYSEESPLE